MSINQRIKTLRKELNLIQQDFAKKIGVQRVTISWMEKEGNTITRQNIKIICDAFNVNENWLRTGEGDMFKPADEPDILDKLQQELKLNNAEMEIIKTFIELSPEQRRMGIQFIKDFSSKLSANLGEVVLPVPHPSEVMGVSHSDTSAQPFPHPSEEMGVSQSDTSSQSASFPGSDHVAESTAAYHAPAGSSARPAGISDDEWQLLQAARREKAQTSGTSDSISSEENRA